MKHLILLLVLPMLHVNCQSQDALSSQLPFDPNQLEVSIDKLVDQYVQLDIFSGVVLVAHHGQPVYHKAFGYADRKAQRKVTVDTRFDIGSMNKAFTKVAILSLINNGKLSLEDSLGTYLKGFQPEVANRVKVKHLLNHTSGIGDYHDPQYWDLPKDQKTIAGSVEKIKSLPLEFDPGSDQMYSNAGYVLLGAIIEQVTGQSYYDVIDEMIVKKLDLKNTFLREKYNIENRAIGYSTTMRGALEDNEYLQEYPKPDGGFYSTVMDILHFFRAYHYGDELWDEATRQLDEMYDFYQEHADSGGAMSHAGGFEGANTVHYEILRDQLSVIVFANMDEPVAEQIGAGILDIIRGQEPKKASLPALRNVFLTINEKGLDYVKDHFEEITINWHPADPKDMILNNIGYNMLFSGDTKEEQQSIGVFRLNTELFPEVANTWDSYGEALLKSGNKSEAIKAYKKALSIDPQLPSALAAIKDL